VHRGRYQAPDRNLGSELLTVMCLSGAAAEELICGPISDDGDQIDIEMVRGYLRERYTEAQLALQLECMPLAARRLVASQRAKIETVAAALLKSGTLTGDEIIALLNGKLGALKRRTPS
jgi:hypothetical protein